MKMDEEQDNRENNEGITNSIMYRSIYLGGDPFSACSIDFH